MADDNYEPNRFLGFPVRPRPSTKDAKDAKDAERTKQRDQESQRFMGFPVDGFDAIDLDWLDSLVHPIRAYQRWRRRSG
jgi:hypothetical protein